VDAAVVVFCGPNFASASEQIVVTARATPPFMDSADTHGRRRSSPPTVRGHRRKARLILVAEFMFENK
jgi:hypothetical protein